VVVHDDAYFGLFYDDEVMKESLFSFTVNLDENILAVKLDGATKEQYVWGLRVGFITFASAAGKQGGHLRRAGEKTMGAIRGAFPTAAPLSDAGAQGAESKEFAARRRKNTR